jgi:hypothetical protein
MVWGSARLSSESLSVVAGSGACWCWCWWVVCMWYVCLWCGCGVDVGCGWAQKLTRSCDVRFRVQSRADNLGSDLGSRCQMAVCGLWWWWWWWWLSSSPSSPMFVFRGGGWVVGGKARRERRTRLNTQPITRTHAHKADNYIEQAQTGQWSLIGRLHPL